jgi:hypothetical protein
MRGGGGMESTEPSGCTLAADYKLRFIPRLLRAQICVVFPFPPYLLLLHILKSDDVVIPDAVVIRAKNQEEICCGCDLNNSSHENARRFFDVCVNERNFCMCNNCS